MTQPKAVKGRQTSETVWVSVGGTIDLGMIDAIAAKVVRCRAAVIRLSEGFQRPNGSGYGLRHIEANSERLIQIKGLGFKTAADCVATAAANWTKIVRATEANRIC